ncbi:MAG: DUF488 domain-containing protein [Chloroflexi bacterium]|nr:DUF488 domain-containing protein [Chloroflexota bacterium]
MKLFTIGFTQKSAENFFETLRANGVRKLVDIRLNPGGQLSGFAKQSDLPYLLARLADDCAYIHLPALAPTKEILGDYRADSDWARYVARFEKLMDERRIPQTLNRADFQSDVCLLCSEPTPEQCHRRLVAERLVKSWDAVEVIHL